MSDKYYPEIAGSQFLPENREADYSDFLRKQLSAERAKVKELSETIESQKETMDSIVKRLKAIESQKSLLREALEDCKSQCDETFEDIADKVLAETA